MASELCMSCCFMSRCFVPRCFVVLFVVLFWFCLVPLFGPVVCSLFVFFTEIFRGSRRRQQVRDEKPLDYGEASIYVLVFRTAPHSLLTLPNLLMSSSQHG